MCSDANMWVSIRNTHSFLTFKYPYSIIKLCRLKDRLTILYFNGREKNGVTTNILSFYSYGMSKQSTNLISYLYIYQIFEQVAI